MPSRRQLLSTGVLTNPAKVDGLSELGVTVTDRLPLVVSTTEHTVAYLAAKRDRMGHDLPHPARGTRHKPRVTAL